MESNHINNIKKIKDLEIIENVSLKKYTTFKLNETASLIAIPASMLERLPFNESIAMTTFIVVPPS